jgi:hypothetical protein
VREARHGSAGEDAVEGYAMWTYVLVAILSVVWLIMIGIGHRRYVALTFAGVIMMICVARAWLDVRRGPPWIRG